MPASPSLIDPRFGSISMLDWLAKLLRSGGHAQRAQPEDTRFTDEPSDPFIEAIRANPPRVVVRPAGELQPLDDGLLEELRDDDPRVREVTAEALGLTGHPDAIRPLIAALHDPDVGVRAAAAEALGTLGAADAIAALVIKLGDPEPSVRATAARAVGNFRDPDTLADIVALMHDPDVDVRRAAAEALAAFGEWATDELVSLLRDPDANVRMLAAQALGESGQVEATTALAPLLTDRNPEVRRAVEVAIGRLGG